MWLGFHTNHCLMRITCALIIILINIISVISYPQIPENQSSFIPFGAAFYYVSLSSKLDVLFAPGLVGLGKFIRSDLLTKTLNPPSICNTIK